MNRLDQFRGCLIGGAAGDALGYEVEFMRERELFQRYPKPGITSYALHDGVAWISDDTQMTLFTANGLLTATEESRGKTEAEKIYLCYLDWLDTQNWGRNAGVGKNAWLNRVEALNSPRAPGNACLSALRSGEMGSVACPINNSKGCGGVMRVAPIGLYLWNRPIEEADRLGAEACAITHGHPLGYLTGAVLVHMIHRIIHDPAQPLVSAVEDGIAMLSRVFPEAEEGGTLKELLELALELAEGGDEDLEAIHRLGEGWVAEEALAIAVYCAVKYADDFDKALIAAVNHKGDSDSTGAITGNILGAYVGLGGIPKKYLEHLECRDVILEMADDLYRGPAPEAPDYVEKYVRCNHPAK